MMKTLLLVMLLCAAPALANETSQYTYQDGILQGFHQDPSETQCIEGFASSASLSAKTDKTDKPDKPDASYRNPNTTINTMNVRTGSSSCAEQYSIVYTVESGGAIYILTPRGDRDESGLLTRALIAHSVLDKQPPHTPIKIRSDGRHFFVKIGDRESEYSAARVE
jgi:hypothetical protein